jgi:ParB/RepB/Spo0J family partition protein
MEVPIGWITPNPANPRKHFDQTALEELAESIKQVGILEPLVVVWAEKPTPEGEHMKFRLVAGERRWRAAQLAGLEKVPIVKKDLTPKQELEVMLIENLQRADLDPLEEAQAYANALAQGYTQTELAEKLGISQSQVANRIRLLKLPAEVQDLISRKIISSGHGLALVKVAHVPELTKEIVSHIAEDGVPVSQAGELVDYYIACDGKPLFTGVFDEPEFNTQEICIKTKCKMRVHGKHRFSSTEHPYCLDPECWERHQDEATKKKLAEKLQEAANENGLDISELLILDDLPWGSYEVFRIYTSIKIEDCHDDCEHLKDAIKRGEAVKACLKPECWKEKEKAIKREQNKEKKENAQAFEAKKDNILQTCSMHEQLPKKVLVYMATQAVSSAPTSGVTTWTRDKIKKQLYKDRGWELPDKECSYREDHQDMVSHMEGLTDRELWDVILYGLLRGITEDDTIYQLTLGAEEDGQGKEEIA